MSDSLIRSLARAAVHDPEAAEELRRVLSRHENGERLRVDMWLPEGEELLVSPTSRQAGSEDPCLHLVTWWRDREGPDGLARLLCTSRGSAGAGREHWRWGEATCRRCNHMRAMLEVQRKVQVHGMAWWQRLSNEAQAVAAAEARAYVVQSLRHSALRLVRPFADVTLSEYLGQGPEQLRLFR